MTKATPHKNAEAIKAFADGETIQWQDSLGDWHDFDLVLDEGPWAIISDVWRVKPKMPWYRVALMANGVGLASATGTASEQYLESFSTFVRWLTPRTHYEP